jgi:hypothetical protein
MSEEQQGIYVFGVVRADAALDALDDSEELPEVSLAEVGDLAAIVSDLPGNEETATRDHVLAHAQVLAAAVETATVVPMRFGMIFPSDEAIRDDLLESRHDELVQLLDRFEGRVQMTLKVTFREEAVLREILDEQPEIARLREAVGATSEQAGYDAKVRLGEMVSAAVEERRQRGSAELLDALKPVAVAALPQPPESELMVLNAPLLVERERLEEFQEAVDEAARSRSELMHFKLLGPMPAYHFTDVEEPAWA